VQLRGCRAEVRDGDRDDDGRNDRVHSAGRPAWNVETHARESADSHGAGDSRTRQGDGIGRERGERGILRGRIVWIHGSHARIARWSLRTRRTLRAYVATIPCGSLFARIALVPLIAFQALDALIALVAFIALRPLPAYHVPDAARLGRTARVGRADDPHLLRSVLDARIDLVVDGLRHQRRRGESHRAHTCRHTRHPGYGHGSPRLRWK